MIHDQIPWLLSKSVGDWSLNIYSVPIDSKAHGCVAAPSEKNPWDISQKYIIKRGNWPKMVKVQQRNKEKDAGSGI